MYIYIYTYTIAFILFIEFCNYNDHKINKSTEAVRKAKSNFEKTLADGVASYPKCFWKYAQSKTKIKQRVSYWDRLIALSQP